MLLATAKIDYVFKKTGKPDNDRDHAIDDGMSTSMYLQ
jgi:hypothetical protein